MEVSTNVEKLVQQSEQKEPVADNVLKDCEEKAPNESNNSEASNLSDTSENDAASPATFKKPTESIGSKHSRSVRKDLTALPPRGTRSLEDNDNCPSRSNKTVGQTQEPPFPYVEPPWSEKPKENYQMEVLKSGVIVDTISLSEHKFCVVGRLPSCHIPLAHPTISRYHAVLQYGSKEGEESQAGLYVCDLGSTHGTFWNGSRIKPNIYVRVRGGHMLRFGCSQRKYILQAPASDQEEESRYSLKELKEMRTLELEQRSHNEEIATAGEQKESEGIDWGMGEDADEETDLQENPYASIADEDLVLEDPKKTLRGWFEREGYDLRYQTEDKGIGQFLCWVNLPLEDIVGHSVRAEALVKGKKKEAVVQCALEACKILDKYGLLRQANHEARKRKARNWEAEDYYDSDEDNFLDRTGSIERKREHRMRLAGKLEEKVETYETLLNKYEDVRKRASNLSTRIQNWQNANAGKNEPSGEDALDAFMSSLSSSALTKSDITNIRLELQNLRKEEASLIKLLNLTRPANLPALSSSGGRDPTPRESKTSKEPSERRKTSKGKLHPRKEKQVKYHKDTNTYAETAMEAKSEEEVDSEDENNPISDLPRDSLHKNDSKVSPSDHVIVDNKSSACTERDEKQEQHQVRIKKHRQTQEKVPYNQDAYISKYSTWVPPQDQAGDGKTRLNERYGY